MRLLQKRGVKYVLHTDGADISALVGERLYSLRLPNKEIHDTTGIGDIFCSTFLCTMLRERDFLWALCFAAGSAQAALDTHGVGLEKVPSRGQVEINASYFYNTVRFR
jgi:sugar/nucleoside kinase (ribokinase family)